MKSKKTRSSPSPQQNLLIHHLFTAIVKLSNYQPSSAEAKENQCPVSYLSYRTFLALKYANLIFLEMISIVNCPYVLFFLFFHETLFTYDVFQLFQYCRYDQISNHTLYLHHETLQKLHSKLRKERNRNKDNYLLLQQVFT